MHAGGGRNDESISPPRRVPKDVRRQINRQVDPFNSLTQYKLSRMENKEVPNRHERLILV